MIYYIFDELDLGLFITNYNSENLKGNEKDFLIQLDSNKRILRSLAVAYVHCYLILFSTSIFMLF